MIQTKTIAMLLLIAIAAVGAVGTTIGTGIAHAQCPQHCPPVDPDDAGHGQSFHDSNGDTNSHGHA